MVTLILTNSVRVAGVEQSFSKLILEAQWGNNDQVGFSSISELR
jgi:hypothetical protein